MTDPFYVKLQRGQWWQSRRRGSVATITEITADRVVHFMFPSGRKNSMRGRTQLAEQLFLKNYVPYLAT